MTRRRHSQQLSDSLGKVGVVVHMLSERLRYRQCGRFKGQAPLILSAVVGFPELVHQPMKDERGDIVVGKPLDPRGPALHARASADRTTCRAP